MELRLPQDKLNDLKDTLNFVAPVHSYQQATPVETLQQATPVHSYQQTTPVHTLHQQATPVHILQPATPVHSHPVHTHLPEAHSSLTKTTINADLPYGNDEGYGNIPVPATTPTESPRRSPRKHSSSGSHNMTKLLADKTVLIDKDVMTLAIRLSKKSAKPAYTLTMKLMPGLFTVEEMAQSKGQGLVSKKDDMRPILDKEKNSALKEYVRCWCRANSIPEPADSEINEAITERISYARKQHKKTLFKTTN